MAEHKNETKKLPQLAQIKVDEKETFNDVISTSTLTSTDLEKKISNFFGSTFVDFEGCKIVSKQINGQEVLKCQAFFKPCPTKGDGLYAVKVRGENTTSPKSNNFGIRDVVNNINMLSKSKQFELEDLAKELLAEYIIVQNPKIVERYSPELKKPVKVGLPSNWDLYVGEVSDTVGHTRLQNPYLVVTLDLIPIVAKLYGKKDPDEIDALSERGIIPRDRYQYAVNIVKVINAQINSFILEIRRIDIKAIKKLSETIGYGVMPGSIVMTRR